MLTKRNLTFFRKAKSMTELSDFNRVHIGCVAVYSGKIIGAGCNKYKTHPIQKKYDSYREIHLGNNVSNLHSLHAEITCLTSIKKDVPFDKVELYIYRKMTKKPFGLARPCPACMAMIKNLGIKKIYYTTDDGFAFEQLETELLEEDEKDVIKN